MPGSPGTMPRSLHDLLICPVCLDTYKDPRTLGCLHSFCTNCLENCRRPYRRDISCPVCKKITPLSPVGIQGLQNDFRIQQIRDIVFTKGGSSGPSGDASSTEEPKTCDICRSQQRQASAECHCIQCYMYFCSSCAQKHNGNPLFTSHHVISMSERQEADALFCRSHREHPVRYFCKSCVTLLCTICTMEHNSDHSPEPLEKGIINKYRTELQGSLNTIKSKLTEAKSKSKYLETLKQSHQRALYEAQQAIKEKTEIIIGKIRSQEKQLLQDVQKHMDEKMKTYGIQNLGEITFQKNSMEALYSEIQNVIKGSPQQCLMAYEEIISRMKNVSDTQLPVVQKARQKKVVKFVPSEDELSIVIGILHECSLSGESSEDEAVTSPVFKRRTSSSPAAHGSESGHISSSSKRVGKRVSSILGALSPNHKELKLGKVKAFAASPERSRSASKSINADDLIGTSSTDLDMSVPSPPGMSSPSSPRPSSCSSPQPASPTSTTMEDIRPFLSTPRLIFQVDQVGGWPGKIMSPAGIALLPGGSVVVAECENRLQVFDQQANSVKIIGWGKIKPHGVTACTDGRVAITDKKDRCVKVFNRDAECLSVWGMGTFGMPSGLAMQSSGNFVVTDVDRHSVSIHRSDGSLLSQFGSWGGGDYEFNNPGHVAVDQFDNIIVSDSCNSCIKIYDPVGVFLRKFTLVSEKQGHIRRPQGISITRQGGIIVADRDSHQITLFNSEGRFTRHLLTKRDGIKYPCDLDVNELNQLAVVETHNGFLTKDPHHAIKLFQL